MSELGRLIKIKEELNKAEIIILKQIDEERNKVITMEGIPEEQRAFIQKELNKKDSDYIWIFDKPVKISTPDITNYNVGKPVDNLFNFKYDNEGNPCCDLFDHEIYRIFRNENKDIIKIVLIRNGKFVELVKND